MLAAAPVPALTPAEVESLPALRRPHPPDPADVLRGAPRGPRGCTSWRARAGGGAPAREVRPVHAMDVLAVDSGRVTLRIVCGKGTYVRVLAADLRGRPRLRRSGGVARARPRGPLRPGRCRAGRRSGASAPGASGAAAAGRRGARGLARPSSWAPRRAAFVHGQRSRSRAGRERGLVRVRDPGGRFIGVGRTRAGGTPSGPSGSSMRILRGLESFPPEQGPESSRSAPSTASISATSRSSGRPWSGRARAGPHRSPARSIPSRWRCSSPSGRPRRSPRWRSGSR